MRRRQTLDGATLCFARNGFHATSVQDVLKEVDLSAGAVYRYFSGKEELIRARIVGEYQDAGMMRADMPPEQVARTMMAAAMGFIAQQALFGPTPADDLAAGLRALMSMGDDAGTR
ncbi:helix-turn-helix domain-containing protein [Streptomyces sp. NRRL B-3229]|uniref:helix-turn-helix domain-containing protein n=1 Tax=Streptomyces sp. NRRL B-3229 TaxID=1463836 RepID=UPI0004BF7648|nr:helix-turn-helix domain-containing protein [Streptomyces sp. NRRL B-3229]